MVGILTILNVFVLNTKTLYIHYFNAWWLVTHKWHHSIFQIKTNNWQFSKHNITSLSIYSYLYPINNLWYWCKTSEACCWQLYTFICHVKLREYQDAEVIVWICSSIHIASKLTRRFCRMGRWRYRRFLEEFQWWRFRWFIVSLKILFVWIGIRDLF